MTAVDDAFRAHVSVADAASRCLPAVLEEVVEVVAAVLDADGGVLAAGNGGSASEAQHLVAELVGRFADTRPAWRAVSLSGDPSTLTSVGNDFGFDRVFARQVEALARPGDVLIVFSTSGRSPSVVEAARTARRLGCRVVALTGEDPGELAGCSDLVVAAPSRSVPRIQEVHGLSVHALVARLEERRSR